MPESEESGIEGERVNLVAWILGALLLILTTLAGIVFSQTTDKINKQDIKTDRLESKLEANSKEDTDRDKQIVGMGKDVDAIKKDVSSVDKKLDTNFKDISDRLNDISSAIMQARAVNASNREEDKRGKAR